MVTHRASAYLLLGLLEALHVEVVEDKELLLLQVGVLGHLSRTINSEIFIMT
jgi:hypothetical protein